eukprot:1416049-Amphidinium_carterae.1
MHGKAVLLQDAKVFGGQQLRCIAWSVECNGHSLSLVRQHTMRDLRLEATPMVVRVHAHTANF